MTSVASGSTSALNYLELLGVESTVHVLDMRFVTSPCLMRLAECGAITHVADMAEDYAPSATWLSATSGVQLVLTDSFGTGATDTARDVDVDASFDPGILNRGEWIKFVSLFFNAEAAANAYFAGVTANVTAMEALAAAAGSRKPVVAFASFASYSGAWQLSNATYKAQYVADAGGTLAAMPPPGGAVSYTNWTNPATTASFETSAALRAALVGVDVLIDETLIYPQSPETYSYASFLTSFGFTPADVSSGLYPFLTNGAVWREDKTLNDGTYGFFGQDWFANGISQPQTALVDFRAVLFPSATSSAGASTTWLRNLARADPFVVRESAQCADPAVTTLCGGPSATLTLQHLLPAAFTPAALQAAVIAALPAGSTAAVTVTDFPITATLLLSAPSGAILAPGTAPADLLSALGTAIGYPLTATAPAVASAGRRHLLDVSLSLPVMIDSFGMAGAPAAAATLSLLNNATALLAAARSAGATGATAASASGASVSATVTVTVKGANAAAGMAQLQSAYANGALGSALVVAGIATPAPPVSSAGAHVGTLVSLLAMASTAVALALA